jgi:hypothetical protein
MSISRLIQFSNSTRAVFVNAAAFLGDGHVAVPQRRARRDQRETTNFMTLFPPNFQIEIRATVFGNLAARERAPVDFKLGV